MRRRSELANASDETLKNIGKGSQDLLETIAATSAIAARVLGLSYPTFLKRLRECGLDE